MSVEDLLHHVRVLERSGAPSRVYAIALSAFPEESRLTVEREIARCAAWDGGASFSLGAGEIFVLRRDLGSRFEEALGALARGHGLSGDDRAVVAKVARRFALPAEAAALARRVEALAIAGGGVAEDDAVSAATEFERALAALSTMRLSPYARRRPIRRRRAGGTWEDGFFALETDLEALADDLGLAAPPSVATPAGRRFHRALDRAWIAQMPAFAPWRDGPIAMIAGDALFGSPEFLGFVEAVEPRDRPRIAFATPWLDHLCDLAAGMGRARCWRELGFAVHVVDFAGALIGPVALDMLKVDGLWLRYDDQLSNRLREPAALRSLRAFGADKVVLSGCDAPVALKLGAELGLRHYEGPLVDELAGAGPTKRGLFGEETIGGEAAARADQDQAALERAHA